MSDLPVISSDGRDALVDFHLSGEGGTSGTACTPALASALDDVKRALQEELSGLGLELAPGPRLLVELYVQAALRERETGEARFQEELRVLHSRLSRHLELDASHAPEGVSPVALAEELGRTGAAIDTRALSRLLPAHRGTKRLPEERRARLEHAAGTIRDRIGQPLPEPAIRILHSGSWPSGLDLPGVAVVEVDDGCAQAVAEFDRAAAEITELLRAVRLARLELAGAFDPGRHDRALARFDWRSTTLDELALFPKVAVLEHADRVRTEGIGALSTLLTSGRPVHVLLADRPLPRIDDGAGLEIGYVAAAHREAFVLQSTLARPAQLVAGLGRLLRSPRSAVAFVAVAEGDVSPELALVAADQARTTPGFTYDPDAGATWASCLKLDGDVRIDQPWPTLPLPEDAEGGAGQAREEAFTAAHAVALTPEGRAHVRRVPRTAWGDDQVELASYLRLDESERRSKLPFIWILEGDRKLARAVVTRQLARVCDDRLAVWRLLGELAGIDNEHARRAAEEVRREIESQAEASTRQLVERHEDELERTRREANEDAVGRIVSALLDFDGEIPIETDAAPRAAVPVPGQPAPADEAPPVAGELELAVTEPYIDSSLCTTCNECTNLNSRMFRYNDDKQAFIADPAAGTFAELVKAAEKCPARCIHPGLPRAGDSTANDRMLARAAKFN